MDIREAAPLTREQVGSLEIGSRVSVTWSGGNGPHEYRILKKATDSEGKATAFVNNVYEDELNFIGDKAPFTVVRLLDKGEQNGH